MRAVLQGYVTSEKGAALEGRSLRLDNVALPFDLEPPDHALTLFYGQHASQQLAGVIQEGTRRNLRVIPVSVRVQLDHEISPNMSLEMLPKVDGMVVHRSSRVLFDLFMQHWMKLLIADGYSPSELDEHDKMGPHTFHAVRPRLIAQLHNHEPFKHLRLIAYPVRDESGKKRCYATVFSDDALTDIRYLAPEHIEIDHPPFT